MSKGSGILVINPGSSTVKIAVIGVIQTGDPSNMPSPGYTFPALNDNAETMDGAALDALRFFSGWDCVGIRIVHGGTIDRPVVVDGLVEKALADHVDLAPAHDGQALAFIRALRNQRPDVPIVACPDRWFHRTIPEANATFAIPWEWTQRYGLRRIGFHGYSHAYATRRTAEILRRPAETLRTVVAHLGSGASLCGILNGRSVDTTMGFTPLDGVMMNQRSGAVDPGILLWLATHTDLSVAAIQDGLQHESGLFGVSGVSGDLREVLAEADQENERASLAYCMYVHRIVTGIASMTASIGGIDALTFTGGVGEHIERLRADVATQLHFLGLEIDVAKNQSTTGDRVISSAASRVWVLVVEAREDIEMAAVVREVLSEP